jgi:hypothetical protein
MHPLASALLGSISPVAAPLGYTNAGLYVATGPGERQSKSLRRASRTRFRRMDIYCSLLVLLPSRNRTRGKISHLPSPTPLAKVAQIIHFVVTLSCLAHSGASSYGNRAAGDRFEKRPDYICAIHHSIGLADGIEPHGVTSLALALLNVRGPRIAPEIIRHFGVIGELSCAKFRAVIGVMLHQLQWAKSPGCSARRK